MEEEHWYVYILEATAKSGRKTIHVGIATNVEMRIARHAAGKVKATAGREVTLLGSSPSPSKSDALMMEAALKTLPSNMKREVASMWSGDE